MPEHHDDENVDIDLEDINKNNSDKEEFEKETGDLPVLGQDNDTFILEKKKKGFFSFLHNDRDAKVTLKTEDIVKDDDLQEKHETNKKDEFILENFEGVYYNESTRITKKKLLLYGTIALAILVGIGFLTGVGWLISSYLATLQVGPCPYECCTDSTYDDKLCPGFATCEGNSCVKEACPEGFECCSGTLYQPKSCENPLLICNEGFMCEKAPCPYACCTGGDDYAAKECANGGNCVNNECFLEACPYECCIDELDYDNKTCAENEVCIENSCKLKLVENTKNFFGFIFAMYDTII
jgi:hypothetical protein